MIDLKSCPFCGVNIHIKETEIQGHKGYILYHPLSDASNCPIVTHEGEMLGIHIYESEQEAADVWNHRLN